MSFIFGIMIGSLITLVVVSVGLDNHDRDVYGDFDETK